MNKLKFEHAALLASFALALLVGSIIFTNSKTAVLSDVSPVSQLAQVSGSGTPWSEILSPGRGIDWSYAGIPGGIPVRNTICATVSEGESTASILDKMTRCPQDQVLQFGPGTFNIDSSIYAFRGIVLRGSGPTRTFLNLVGGNILLSVNGTNWMGNVPTGLGSSKWTGGLTKGNKVLTVASTAGIRAGQTIALDQYNDSRYVSPLGIESSGHCLPYNSCGRNDNPLGFSGAESRAQVELVSVQSIDSPTQLTIAGPGISHDYDPSLSPEIFYWNTNGAAGPGNIKNAGVEDMTIDAMGHDYALNLEFCDHCWVKNIVMKNQGRAGVFFWWGLGDEVRDSYFTDTRTGAPRQYAIEANTSSYTRIENNIFNNVFPAIMTASSYGLVAGYNFASNNVPGAQFVDIATHAAHDYFHLYEGNIMTMVGYDDAWGSGSHNTLFRNRLTGYTPGKSYAMASVILGIRNYHNNFVGNILGDLNFHQYYVCDDQHLVGDYAIYSLGFANFCGYGITDQYPYDKKSVTTLMRWGNWDSITYKANGNTNGVRYCTANGAGNSSCTEDESGRSAVDFPGLSNPSTSFPSSFYLSSKPSWFGNVIWPPIGPDVTCSGSDCLPNVANHVAKIPALLCYEKLAKDANGFLTSYDANSCYGNTPPTPLAPNILTPPSNQSGAVGDSATFSVNANGYPTPSYQWQKATSVSGPWTNIGSNSSSLTLTSLTLSDNNTYYRVTVSNSAGTVSSSAVILTVTTAPSTLIGDYKFNETSGTTAVDSSEYGRNATLVGATFTTGRIGNAISLNGSSYLTAQSTGASMMSPSKSSTISVWVYPTALPGDWGAVVSQGANNPGFWWLGADSGGKWYITGGGCNLYGGNVALNTWTHLALVQDTTTRMIYVNGNLVGTVNGCNSGNTSPLYIGRTEGFSEYFIGKVDELKLYTEALSLDEIQDIYGIITPPPPPPTDTTLPSVSITSPTVGQTVNGTITISATASDNVGVAGVQFWDGNILLGDDTSSPYSYTWNTVSAVNGSHTLKAVARDAAGNTKEVTVTVTVSNVVVDNPDTTPPSTPTNLTGSAVSQAQINLSWGASTDPTISGAVTSGLVGYKIYRNGVFITNVTGATTFQNNSGIAANTTYTYQVSAYDNVGLESARSNQITVTTPPAPTTGIQIGDRVQTTNNLKVRATASTKGSVVGTARPGTKGTVMAGPAYANGYTWWNISYDNGVKGWSAQNWLLKI